MHAHDDHNQRQGGLHARGLAEAVNDGHEDDAHSAVVHNLRQQHGGQPDAQSKDHLRAFPEKRHNQLHEKGGNAAVLSGHADGERLDKGKQQHNPPRHTGIDHNLEVEQRLAVNLDGAHDGHQQNDDAGIAYGLEKAGQEVGSQQQGYQQE